MTYTPGTTPKIDDADDLRKYVEDELKKIAQALNEQIAVDLRPVFRAPDRPREGMLVYADGSDWNPGSGEGVYVYKNAAWSPLDPTTLASRILQIVQVNSAVQTSVIGVTFATTGVAASITLASVTSKVLILVSGTVVSNTINTQAIVRLRRGSTALPPQMRAGGSGGTAIATGAIAYLDSPTTAGVVSYDTQVASDTVGANALFPFVDGSGGSGTIVLIEIKP